MNSKFSSLLNIGSESVLIWGAGRIGAECYQIIKNDYNVEGFIDSNASKKEYCGMLVFPCEVIKRKKARIIIAMCDYSDALRYCFENMLTPVIDFITYDVLIHGCVDILPTKVGIDLYDAYVKEIKNYTDTMSVFGNCQSQIIYQYLLHNRTVNENYILLRNETICDLKCFEDFEKVIKNSDVVITQNISSNNRFGKMYSTEKIKEIVLEGTKIVIISNLFFDGYFPQMTVNNIHNVKKQYRYGIFPDGDMLIDDLLKRYCAEDVLKIISYEGLFGNTIINMIIESRREDLQSREQFCDIKMGDFIFANYQKQRLFYSVKHPTNYVIKELCNRILEYLNLENARDNYYNEADINSLDLHDNWIYPSVKKMLDLKFEMKDYKEIGRDETMSFEEVCAEYIRLCHLK